jgi:hypothetical protein
MTRILRAVVVLLVGVFAMKSPSAAPAPKGPVRFQPFGDFNAQGVGRLDIKVLGWRVKEPPKDAFPASFWANTRCSATLIGEEVLISAGHCFTTAPEVSIQAGGLPYTGLCQTAQQIKHGAKADFAICAMDKPVKVTQFETVDLSPTAVKVDDDFILTGFGGNTPTSFGKYLIGGTTVSAVKQGIVVTRDGAWTRPGDSGGAGFSVGDHRRLVSVNARVETNLKTSYATLLSTVADLIKQWQSGQRPHKRVAVCGLDPDARKCRQ